MTPPIFTALALSLGLTLVLELTFALLSGVRGRPLLLVALVNLLTNPAVVFFYFLLSQRSALPRMAVQLPLEGAAILTEALCYARCSGRDFPHPWRFSLLANLFSYGTGRLLLSIFG